MSHIYFPVYKRTEKQEDRSEAAVPIGTPLGQGHSRNLDLPLSVM